MNRADDSLQKLLRAASQARPELPESPPFRLEAAVLAHWRRSPKEDDFAALLALFRRAILFALVIMTLSGAWNYFGSKDNEGTTALANYAMTQFPP